MYKRILVAIDGSDTSDRALEEAVRLAKETGAQLRIVHAVDEVILNWDAEYANPAEIWEAMAKTGRDLLDKATARAAAAGVQADSKLIELTTLGHRIPEAIVEEAQAWPADLIVLGTHGRRGLSHVFLGSVAEGVVRVATKPVLLIRSS
ncbi:universal stress protein [Thiobacter aerophilum]|uniref:Universal stress protein n=1 Tax=Thiobacter aerophilum TaxID=3121275 RepID=A0ABV0EE63_9BURK